MTNTPRLVLWSTPTSFQILHAYIDDTSRALCGKEKPAAVEAEKVERVMDEHATCIECEVEYSILRTALEKDYIRNSMCAVLPMLIMLNPKEMVRILTSEAFEYAEMVEKELTNNGY